MYVNVYLYSKSAPPTPLMLSYAKGKKKVLTTSTYTIFYLVARESKPLPPDMKHTVDPKKLNIRCLQ